jgi:hypothetical protein
MENLKALVYGRELTAYQRGLAVQEFEKLIGIYKTQTEREREHEELGRMITEAIEHLDAEEDCADKIKAKNEGFGSLEALIVNPVGVCDVCKQPMKDYHKEKNNCCDECWLKN